MDSQLEARGVPRTVALISELLRGEEFDRTKAARTLRVKEPAAYAHLKTIAEGLRGVRKVRRGRTTFFRFDLAQHLGTATDAMLVSASFGAGLAALFEPSPYAEEMRAAFRELLRRSEHRELFEQYDRKFAFVRRGGEVGLTEGGAALLALVVTGVLENRCLRINYAPLSRKKERWTVRPLAVVVYEHQLYLLAERLTRGASAGLYPFRFARLLDVRVQRTRFVYPTSFDPHALFKHSFGMFISNDGPVIAVRVRLTGSWARYSKTHRWHETQTQVADDERGVVLEFRVRRCAELETWLLARGEECEVLSPAELRASIAERLRAAAACYEPRKTPIPSDARSTRLPSVARARSTAPSREHASTKATRDRTLAPRFAKDQTQRR